MVSELRQRLRGRRWWVVLGLWFLVLLGLVALARAAVSGTTEIELGPFMFGSLALFVLSLACLVVPSLTSGAINGERQSGTMAVLQATLLRPWEIVVAKLGAAVLTASAFLAATLPLALWCFAEGGVNAGAALVTYLLLLVTSTVLAAVGLAASALVRRGALAAVTAYAVVFALTIGSPIVFGLSFIGADSGDGSSVGSRWVLLAPNPVVVLADAVPPLTRERTELGSDPLGGLGALLRELRSGSLGQPGNPPPIWPVGLGFQVILAALATTLAVDRLRVPARRLRPGERVA